uniref:Uncharacterized protein n=1 Tax=Avena sativa TaxID=4498 RepID=A0ACD5TYB4_AVESA
MSTCTVPSSTITTDDRSRHGWQRRQHGAHQTSGTHPVAEAGGAGWTRRRRSSTESRTLLRKQEGLGGLGGGGAAPSHAPCCGSRRGWVDSAAEEQHRVRVSSHRISRVPVHLRENNDKDYMSGFIAIGPLHNREDLRLRPAEWLKVVYLNGLISRGYPDPAHHLTVIQDYVRIVAAREQEARAMYVNEELADIDADDFIEMMVLDGCFIIEHLVNVAMAREEVLLHATPSSASQLSVDLILAENQMPFFILVDLFAATKLPEFETTGYDSPVLLVKLVLFYLAGENARDMNEALLPAADAVSHILHLFHAMITKARTWWCEPPSLGRTQARLLRHLESLFMVPLLHRIFPEGPRRRARLEDYVLSASDMKQMRVQFKKARGQRFAPSVVGIAWVLGPVPLAVMLYEGQLQLPQLRLESRTAPLLLNLMVFEQSPSPQGFYPSQPQDVSSYVAFMAKLVQSAEDARLLADVKVLQLHGSFGDESMQEVPRFFRVVGAASKATGELEGSYLRTTLELLRSRSDSWVDLERKYFTFLAVFLAFVTFVSGVATIFQTYAAFKYH